MIANAAIAAPGKVSGSQQQQQEHSQGKPHCVFPPLPHQDSATRGSAFSEEMPNEGRVQGRSAARDACRASTIVEEGPQDLAGGGSSIFMQGKTTHARVMLCCSLTVCSVCVTRDQGLQIRLTARSLSD